MTIIPALFKLAAVLSIIFTASVALIRIQPYNAPDLRGLTPEYCPLPCFMGIRPGLTTGYDALELLRTNDWVRYIQNVNVSTGTRTFSGSISWEWSGGQPLWVDTDRDSLIWIDENRVDQITIPIRYSLGEIWLAYGDPDFGRLFVSPNADLWIAYRGVYIQHGFFVEAGGACPARNYWYEKALLNFRSGLLSSIPDTSASDSGLPLDMIRCVRWLTD